MPVIGGIAGYHDDMTAWRRHLHAYPETAFEEKRTSDFLAARLGELGLEVDRGLAGTGVVANLVNASGPAIGLRADMDGLRMREANDFAHKSTHPGKMHGCGHDGHMAMLLGAARYLAETRRFKGAVRFIFQPAEENEGGARAMIDDGLLDRFPLRAVFGMHNWPGLPVGEFAAGTGPMMAAVDTFEVRLRGAGAHAAMPHLGTDPLAAAAEIAVALGAVSTDDADPVKSVVLSVTQVHGGDTWNVIPDTALVRGTARAFLPKSRDAIEAAIRRAAAAAAAVHGVTAEVDYQRRYPTLVNHPGETEVAARAAALVVGKENVERHPPPTMGGEDFAFMLDEVPGCYVWIGNGPGAGGCVLHNPRYDFNDDILTIGASYWARLVESVLG